MSRIRLILSAGFGLALCAPLVLGLAGLSGIGHRWVDILAQFVGPAMAAAIGLTVMAAGFRLWIAAGWGGIVCAVVLAAGWPQWAPPKGAPAGDEGFTLYSANVYAWNDDTDAIARSVEASGADVVLLIELGDVPAAELATILKDHPYRLSTWRTHEGSGPSISVIGSRWPLTQVALNGPRMHGLVARLRTPLGPVTLSGLHMTRPWPYQYQWGQIIQAQALIDWRAGIEGPLVVAGDFNSVSSARIGRMIRAEAGLIPAPGWPGTWPAQLPAWAGMTIDQVYRSPDLALTERRIGRPNGSDHRPVITRFVRAAPAD